MNMKTLAALFAAALILVSGCIMPSGSDNVSKYEFDQYRREYRAETDSLKRELRKVSKNVDTLRIQTKGISLSVDTLKEGQYIIYEQVRETAGQSFWNHFRK